MFIEVILVNQVQNERRETRYNFIRLLDAL